LLPFRLFSFPEINHGGKTADAGGGDENLAFSTENPSATGSKLLTADFG
jgi:hypothetical protein